MDLFLFLTHVLFIRCLDDAVELESPAALALSFTSAVWGTLYGLFSPFFSPPLCKVASGSFSVFKPLCPVSKSALPESLCFWNHSLI